MGHVLRESRGLAGRRWSVGALLAGVLSLLMLSPRPGGVSAREPLTAPPMPADAETTHVLITSGNNIGLAVYSDGFFGDNNQSRRPSMEYPNGTDQDHLVRAGIWVGGLYSRSGPIDEADTVVAIVTRDGYQGSDPRNDNEFDRPAAGLLQRSTLIEHPFYDRYNAKSEQDVICAYREQPADTMLHVEVVQEILQFSFEPYDAITLVNFYIVNVDSVYNGPIYDIAVGFYAELCSGWKGGHDEWPPSGWFYHNDIAYTPGGVEDTLRLLTEHRHLLDNGNCPSWAGMKLLGTRPDTIASKVVSFNWWDWDPYYTQGTTPLTDGDQYRTMLNGEADATSSNEALSGDLSPVTVISVGPLGKDATPDSTHFILLPGDSVLVSYALLGGIPTPDASPPRSAEEDIHYNALHAQTAFDLNFNIPIPPPSPRLYVEPSHSGITLWWDDEALAFIDPKSHQEDFEGFRIYISEQDKASGFELLGEFDLVDSLFYNTSLEAITAPEPKVIVADGDTTYLPYRYRIAGLRDGFKYWVSVTSFDTGTIDMPSLESGISQNLTFVIPGPGDEDVPGNKVVVFPNPYHGDAAWDEPIVRDRYLWFAGLPPRCKIRIYSLAGDLIKTIDFDGATYGATDVRGIYDPDDRANPARDIPTLSGGMAAWDLTSRMDQAVATGLYVFSVENLDNGNIERGKFLIMK